MDLVVRTANLMSQDQPHLRAIVNLFYDDWPLQTGVIGLQEVNARTPADGPGFCGPHGSQCLASMMRGRFDTGVTAVGLNTLGIVAGEPWSVSVFQTFVIGNDRKTHPLLPPNNREVIEGKIKHISKSWTFRFYNTHLSHTSDAVGNQTQARLEQARNLVRFINSRVQDGELPPILVGDFNMTPSEPDEREALNTIREYFVLVNKDEAEAAGCLTEGGVEVDQIWVGRRDKFPQTRGSFEPIRHHGRHGKGLPGPEGFDHDFPAMSFKVRQ